MDITVEKLNVMGNDRDIYDISISGGSGHYVTPDYLQKKLRERAASDVTLFNHGVVQFNCTVPVLCLTAFLKAGLTVGPLSPISSTSFLDVKGFYKSGFINFHLDSEELETGLNEMNLIAGNTLEDAFSLGVNPIQAAYLMPPTIMGSLIITGSLTQYAELCRQLHKDVVPPELRTLAREIGKEILPSFPISWKILTEQTR